MARHQPPAALLVEFRREEVPDPLVLDVLDPAGLVRVPRRERGVKVPDRPSGHVLVELGGLGQHRGREEPVRVVVRAVRPRQRPLPDLVAVARAVEERGPLDLRVGRLALAETPATRLPAEDSAGVEPYGRLVAFLGASFSGTALDLSRQTV